MEGAMAIDVMSMIRDAPYMAGSLVGHGLRLAVPVALATPIHTVGSAARVACVLRESSSGGAGVAEDGKVVEEDHEDSKSSEGDTVRALTPARDGFWSSLGLLKTRSGGVWSMTRGTFPSVVLNVASLHLVPVVTQFVGEVLMVPGTQGIGLSDFLIVHTLSAGLVGAALAPLRQISLRYMLHVPLALEEPEGEAEGRVDYDEDGFVVVPSHSGQGSSMTSVSADLSATGTDTLMARVLAWLPASVLEFGGEAREVWNMGGVQGLWRYWWLDGLATAVLSVNEMLSQSYYDLVTHLGPELSTYATPLCLAGLAASVLVASPLFTIVERMWLQDLSLAQLDEMASNPPPADEETGGVLAHPDAPFADPDRLVYATQQETPYLSPLDCASRIWNEEGLWAFYRGAAYSPYTAICVIMSFGL